MTIKNIGRKIIGFGQTSVLPDEPVTIPDTYKSIVLDTYVALGIVEVIETAKEKTDTKTGKGGKGGKSGGGKNTETEETAETETETNGDAETGKE